MKIRYTPTLIGFCFAAATLSAQQAPETENKSNLARADETVELSPFVVSGEQESGYGAKNTLAGTRISTSLKDLGGSISVYTKDFLNDIGATSANDFLIYATGMEAAGTQGNFSGVAGDINAVQVTGDSPRTNPQNATRTRGLAAPNFTRAFFNTSIPVDSYNTELVTVNRGPNAILFGVGSPAGVVDATLSQPHLTKDSRKLEFRYGNNDSLRYVLDINEALIPRKLAIRLIGLDEDEQYNQRPAYQHKQRLYGAITAKPFSMTTLRGNFETGRTRANRPLSVLPFKSIADAWTAAGQPVYDWTFYDDPARNPNAANQNANIVSASGGLLAPGQFFDQIGIFYSQPNATTPDLSFRGQTLGVTTTAADAIRNNLFHPLVNRDSRADAIVYGRTLNIGQLPASAFPGGVIPAGLKMQGFTDLDAFDFNHHMLDETSRQGDTFHTFNLALEQLVWNGKAGVELAYNNERYNVYSKNSFSQSNNSNHISIDINVTLPTGQPNPNLGRPGMVYGQTNWTNSTTDRETARLTAFLKHDFTESGRRLGWWLGRHTLTGLLEQNKTKTFSYNSRLVTFGDAANAINPDPNAFGRRPGIFVNIGDSVLGGQPLKLQPIQIPELKDGMTVQTTYFVAPAGSATQGDFRTVTTTLREINSGGTAAREIIESQALVLQSYWLAEHLITTLGWRRDEDFAASQSLSFVAADPYNLYGSYNPSAIPSRPPLTAAKEVKTYSAVLRWPQKLWRLPFGADASIFVNASENFTPLGGRQNVYNQMLASPQGETKEYGFNLSLFEDRLNVRVNRFETSVQGQSFANPAFVQTYNNGVLQATGFWAQERNVNPGIDRTADIELMYSALPANFREQMQWRVSGTAAQQNLSNSYTLTSGISDTTDYTAKGTEMEVLYSPNKNWRFLLNVAKQETVQSNTAPGMKEFVARMLPVWNQLRNVPRENYPSGYQPGDPITGQTFGQFLDNNILIPLATTLATEGSASAEQRKWRANFVGSYTFDRAGWLKGWAVGGGVRWQDKLGIGYPVSRNPDSSVNIDIAHPYYAPAETNFDLFASYSRKIFRDKILWKAQLNVRNAFGSTDLIGVTAQPWGETAIARIAPERRWYLTNTFSF